MSQKWNLQDIRPAGSSQERAKIVPKERPRQDITPTRRPRHEVPRRDPEVSTVDIIDGNGAKKKRIIISAAVVIVILVAGFLINMLLGGAEITIFPKFKAATVQATFTAYKEPKVGDLSYELLTLEASGERQVAASGEEEVSERAQGSIFIYNAHSESPQRLIKNTRFESPEGLIFRISESVEVPGMTTDDSGEIVPGIITAEVFADGPGEQYNIKATRFTIPGLAGSEQFDGMYAESTDGFSGGFEGSKFLIDEGELQTAQQALHLELRNALLARLPDERPAGFILYDDAVTFAFDTLPATEYGDELATIKERARLQVPMFKATEFAEYLAENTVAGYEGEPVMLTDPQTLTFSYPSPTTTTSDIAPNTKIEFTLTGNTQIVWEFDQEKLQNDLKGLPKTALPNVFSAYPAIDSADAVVRPFWRQSLPDQIEEITIETIVGENQ